ncbi:peptidase M23 [Leptospira interrogans]|nr:peptidase M23 [Leptospira interrogans]UNE65233.1 peptidase M23 [Leptospira interrogans]
MLQGSSQALNIAANSAVSKYLDDYAKKLQKDNEERSSNLQKTLLESLTNGDDYKYLRDAGYGFRVDGEGITAYREIYSGEIAIDGSAMKSTSYSPDLEYQYIRIETKFNPGNLSVDIMDPNSNFDANKVADLKNYIDNLQKNVESMFAQFSNKTNEIKEEYVQNKEIESYQKKLYEASKDNYLAAFQALPGEFKEAFEGEMGNTKDYHSNSRYSFSARSFNGLSGDTKKIGKSMYDGVNIDDTVFAGSRELKGSVSVKGIPVEVSYGMQYLIVTSGFDISNLGYNFKLKGLGTSYVDSQLSGVSQKYSVYTKDIQDRIERQAKSNDEEMDKKGFVFNVLNGMSGGQKVTQAVEGEIRSRVTGAIAEASGLPASFVGALVGGGSVKDAMKAYEKSVTTEAISKATGIPGWYLDQKMAEKEANHAMTTSFSYNMATSMVGSLKYSPPLLAAQALIPGLKEDVNKFVDHVGREAYKNRETIDTAVTVAMTVAAPFSGGASLVALAAYKAAEGAVEGGVLGALAGAANVGNAFLYEFTGGTVSYNLSYSYADGFGASIGGGWKIANGLGVGATLSYNENQGFGGSVGLQAGTSALSFNAGLSYSQRDGVSANAGVGIGLGGKKPTGSLNLGVSYNRQDGLGTSVGISSNNNKITHGMGLNITRSEYGGWGADVSTDNYGPGNLSGGLAYTQRDGFTVSLNVNGTNAFNYNSQSGLSGNGDFMSQYVMNNGLAQGVSDESDTSEPNSAQQHNNAEQGAQAIEGAGFATQRREGEGHVIGFSDDGPEPAHGNPGVHDTGQTITSSGSVEGTGVSRQLSAADVAEFKADWRKESPAQTDASLAALKSAGYDTSGLEKFVTDYRNGKAANSSQGSTPTTQTTHQSQGPTVLYGGAIQNALSSIADGAKGLWNKMTGGSPQGVYNSAGIEAGIDKVLASKAAYDPGYEQKGANWTPGKLENGERYSNIHYTQSKDADGNTVYEKVYRNYDSKEGKYTVAGTESVTAAAYNAAIGSGDYQRFTSCNMVNHEIATSFGAVSPFMPEKAGTQYHANDNPNTGKKGIYGNLQNGKYDTDTHQYRQVGFEDAEKNASRGGLSIAVNDGHIVTVTGGYTGTQGKAADLNVFQGGKAGVGSMNIQAAFGHNDSYFTDGKKLQYYIWEKK